MNWLKKYKIKQKQRRGKLDSFLSDYLSETDKVSKSTPIEEVSFVVVDTETTGLDPRTDKIISIGAVKVYKNQIHFSESFEKFIYHQNIGNKETTPVHQILSQDIKEAKSEAEVLKEWLSFSKGTVLVAHHAYFDTQILSHHLLNNFELPLFNLSVDTMRLAQRLEGQANAQKGQKYDLDTLSQTYNITNLARHSAIGDALATAELFLHLVGTLKKRGNKTLKDLLK